MAFVRPVGSMHEPRRLNLRVEAAAGDRLKHLADTNRLSQSALLEWLVMNVKTDHTGRIDALRRDQEELPA